MVSVKRRENPQSTRVFCVSVMHAVSADIASQLVHNHPSGDPSPSRADIDMTREVAEAGAKLGVTLHDHIIISKSGHTSLKSMGVI